MWPLIGDCVQFSVHAKLKNQMLLKTGCSNVVRATLILVVNNIVQHW